MSETGEPAPSLFCTRPGCRRLLLVFFAMFFAQGVGSAFNIAYNLTHIAPLLTKRQLEVFEKTIEVYNIVVYPILVVLWGIAVFRVCRPVTSNQSLLKRQQAVINLPLIATVIAGTGWLLCIPTLMIGLRGTSAPLNPHLYYDLPVSVLIGMVIALTIGYFLIDWLRQRYLFPYFFDEISPGRIEGAFRLSISNRGRIWTLAASICPILALLMLSLSPTPVDEHRGFAISVAAGGIFTAVVSGILMSRLILKPVEELRLAAQDVGKGDLETKIGNLRADEFGILADEFNAMISGLREKEHISTTFGRHVGKEIARELLEAEEELKGVERTLSVLFADVRGFTTKCENLEPARAVQLLNLYHTHMTETIESHNGIVNQLVGDGIMSLFGATGQSENHANDAVAAGLEMIRSLERLNPKLAEHGFEPLRIGVGINTGPAVVGTIGSARRMEYTAIGDTVNTAARIEGLTKEAPSPLLIAESTWELCDPKPEATRLDPIEIRGRKNEIVLYSLPI